MSLGGVTPVQCALGTKQRIHTVYCNAKAGLLDYPLFDKNRDIFIEGVRAYYVVPASGAGTATLKVGTNKSGADTIVDVTLSTSATVTAANEIVEFTLENDLKGIADGGGDGYYGVIVPAGDLVKVTLSAGDGNNSSEFVLAITYYYLDLSGE